MAKIPTTKRFILEEYPKEVRSWFDKFLAGLNDFILNVNSALNNNLTFSENLSAQVTDIEIQTTASGALAFEYSFKNNLKGSAKGVWVIGLKDQADNPVPNTNGFYVDWSNGNGQIIINAIPGLDASRTYLLTLIAITG